MSRSHKKAIWKCGYGGRYKRYAKKKANRHIRRLNRSYCDNYFEQYDPIDEDPIAQHNAFKRHSCSWEITDHISDCRWGDTVYWWPNKYQVEKGKWYK